MKLENNTDTDWELTITDKAATQGNLLVKLAGAPGEGVKLGKPKESTTIKRNSQYQIYLDTTLSVLGIHFTFSSGKESVTFHVTKNPLTDEEVAISSKSLADCSFTFNPRAFRTSRNGSFIVISPAR
jgi:hypothetical protein